MFDVGALELLVIIVVAIIVIGPKDMPAAMRVAGRWVGKLRRASAQIQAGFDNIVREAEMQDMEKKWKEQNAKIMAETPEGEMGPLAASAEAAIPPEAANGPVDLTEGTAAAAPADTPVAGATADGKPAKTAQPAEPGLPLGNADKK